MASLKRFATLGAAGAAPPPASDSQFNLTTLLLHGDGTNGAQNNTFIDSSTNNFTITRNGNTTQGTFTPFSQTGWSIGFNRTNYQNILTPTSADFNMSSGTGDFTIEFFINNASLPGGNFFHNIMGSTSQGTIFLYGASPNIYWRNAADQDLAVNVASGMSLNTWYHIACVRSGTTYKIYMDGVEITSGTGTPSASANQALSIGTAQAYNNGVNGSLSNFRFTRSAVYTSNFTPPSSPLTTTSQGVSSSNVKLLVCKSNRFIDESANALVISLGDGGATNVGTRSVQAFSPFAPTSAYSTSVIGGSGYFDGNSDYLALPTNINSSIGSLAGKQLTFEFWINTTNIQAITAFDMGVFGNSTSTAVNGRYYIALLAAGTTGPQSVSFGWTTSTSTIDTVTATSTLPLNSWNHVAITINATTASSTEIVIYINGVGQTFTGKNLSSHTTDPAIAFRLGNDNSSLQSHSGYISDFKISSGIQRSSNFTPPTLPLTSDANTILLTSFTNAGIIDNTSKNDLETVGNAKISTAVTKFGTGSLAFDGTGDWLTFPNSPITQIGTGNFTIEGWVYINATGVAYGLISKGTSTTGWSVNITSGNKLQFSYTATALTGVTSLAANTWYYFAVVRSGTATGNLKVYLNGSVDATSAGAVTDNFNQTNIGYVGADRVGGSALNGYLDDIRVTLAARTIATPTAAFLDQ